MLLVSGIAFSQQNKDPAPFFIENKGRWDSEVLYLYQLGGLNAWITQKGVVYDFYHFKEKQSITPVVSNSFQEKLNSTEYEKYGHVIGVYNKNVNQLQICEPKYPKETYYNYFMGSEEKTGRAM